MSTILSFIILYMTVRWFTFADEIKATVGNGTEEEKKEERMQFLRNNQRLYDHLFRNYNPDLPPVYTKRSGIGNLSVYEPVVPDKDEFSIILMYAKLLEVDPPKQIVTLLFEYITYWYDERLQWNPAEFGDINHIYVLRKNVWVPEITPFDSTEVIETRPDYKQHVTIRYNGNLDFYTTTLTSVTCHIDVLYFPFDMHNCSVKLLSYTFYTQEIAYSSEIFEEVIPKETGTEEWDVTAITAHSELMFEDAGVDATQVNEFTFLLRRNPSYYLALIIVPSFILNFLCILGLFSSPGEDGDLNKFSMGLTTMMSTTVMIGIVTDNIPKTKAIPHLCNFIILNLLVVGVANVVVVYLPKLGRFVTYCMKKRNPKSARRYSLYVMIVVNIIVLAFFEALNVWNLVGLLQGSLSFPFIESLIT